MLINLLAFLGGMTLGAGLALGAVCLIISADVTNENYRKERERLEGRCDNEPRVL